MMQENSVITLLKRKPQDVTIRKAIQEIEVLTRQNRHLKRELDYLRDFVKETRDLCDEWLDDTEED